MSFVRYLSKAFIMKKYLIQCSQNILFLLLPLVGFSQKCNHANQIQSLYSQLVADGFDTKTPIAYRYFFVDSNEQDILRLKAVLLQQNYRHINTSRNGGKFQLEVEKTEAHNAESATQKGKVLNELAKANNVDAFDGFEMKASEMVEEPSDLNAFRQQVNKIPTADLYKKAMEFYDKNDNDKALVVLDRCIQQRVNLEASYYKRANCKTTLGKTQEAIADLENSLRLNSQNYAANFNLGGLYFDSKNYEKAVLFYEKAVSINISSDDAYYRLAETYQKLDRKDDALQSCQKALKINPSNAYARNLMKTLN